MLHRTHSFKDFFFLLAVLEIKCSILIKKDQYICSNLNQVIMSLYKKDQHKAPRQTKFKGKIQSEAIKP